jgi:uncharacterized sulfatase
MLFEESNRVPLIFAGAGVAGRGASSRIVEVLDIYPTLVELCGLPKPRHKLEGESLLPLLQDPNAPRDRPAYSQVQRGTDQTPASPPIMGRSVRTESWRYSEWDGGRLGRELYDHDHDPHEFRNLADDPTQARIVSEMKQLLRNSSGQQSGE